MEQTNPREGEMLNLYFSVNYDGLHETHETRKAARKAVRRAIRDADGDDDCHWICWGRVLGVVKNTSTGLSLVTRRKRESVQKFRPMSEVQVTDTVMAQVRISNEPGLGWTDDLGVSIDLATVSGWLPDQRGEGE